MRRRSRRLGAAPADSIINAGGGLPAPTEEEATNPARVSPLPRKAHSWGDTHARQHISHPRVPLVVAGLGSALAAPSPVSA